MGERCGNADLITIVANLALKKSGYEVLQPGSLQRLTELSRYVYETGQHEFPAEPAVRRLERVRPQGRHARPCRRPSVGTATNTSLRRRVGNERRILVSELSGRSNIMAMTSEPRHPARSRADGQNPGPGGRRWRSRATSSRRPRRSFDLLVQAMCRHVPAALRAAELSRQRREPTPRGAADDRGHGENARRRVDPARSGRRGRPGQRPGRARCARPWPRRFPSLADMHLVDYKVRVINTEAGTAAGVRVVIESRDEHDVWGTVGRERKHDRGQLDRAGRQLRIQAVQG